MAGAIPKGHGTETRDNRRRIKTPTNETLDASCEENMRQFMLSVSMISPHSPNVSCQVSGQFISLCVSL